MSYDGWKLADGAPRGEQDDRPWRCDACREREHDDCDGRACGCDCRDEVTV